MLADRKILPGLRSTDPSADELHRVVQEIAEALEARAVVLTVHPDDEAPPRIVHADPAAGFDVATIERLIDAGVIGPSPGDSDEHRWARHDVDASSRDILLIPVHRVEGHSRMVISAFFDRLTDETREKAEAVYLRRRPFAVGYFRLWQLKGTLVSQVAALEGALNVTDMGVLLLDRSSELLFANRSGREILDRGDGLRRRKHSIAATHLDDSVRLQVALDHVVAQSESGEESGGRRSPILSLRRAERPPLIVSVLPTEKKANEPRDAAAILYVLDPEFDTARLIQPVCKVYQLSPVETQLVCLLTAGTPLANAADKMRIKERTARSYLKQIFAKTNTNRQADLILLMLSSHMRTSRDIMPEAF